MPLQYLTITVDQDQVHTSSLVNSTQRLTIKLEKQFHLEFRKFFCFAFSPTDNVESRIYLITNQLTPLSLSPLIPLMGMT